MYSSEDLERFYLDYQSEWVPRGMTLQAYCSRNNVPFKVMDKFVKDIRKRIYEVKVEGRPEGAADFTPAKAQPSVSKPDHESVKEDKKISVLIRIGNGTEVSQRGLDYSGLKSLIEKLEVLC